MFKTLQGPEGPQISKGYLRACVIILDDWYELSQWHSKRRGLDQIGCERTQFIGYLSEAAHYAMNDVYNEKSSFYTICKENDDNIIGKHIIEKDNSIIMNFNLFNSLGLNIPYASQRASDFCWEVFSDIKVTNMENHLWNVEIVFDLDLINDRFGPNEIGANKHR